jgi:hypothetical protein
MLDRGASINQQQMAMCNVQTSQLLSTLCFVHIVQRINHFIFFLNLKKKEREVPQVLFKKPKGNN